MSTIELKKELHQIIDNSDANFVKNFYKMVKDYMEKSENCKMVEESEDDIKAGRIHSLSDVKETIKSWK